MPLRFPAGTTWNIFTTNFDGDECIRKGLGHIVGALLSHCKRQVKLLKYTMGILDFED